jgi:hypothetical protein
MNTFWCLYNFGLLSTVFYFNQAEETNPQRPAAIGSPK